MMPMTTDGCPQCVSVETSFIRPQRITEANGVTTFYHYKCPTCGTEWDNGGKNDAPDLPEGDPRIVDSG